jgi:hypothetical protein
MARHSFAPIDALLALACTVIFAGGVLAEGGGRDQDAPPRTGQPPIDAQLKAQALASEGRS